MMGRYRLQKYPFNHISESDLRSNQALDELLDYAVGKGWYDGTSEAQRLDWYAYAERALRVGKNPGKVFATLIKRRLKNNITVQDEERARQRLRNF